MPVVDWHVHTSHYDPYTPGYAEFLKMFVGPDLEAFDREFSNPERFLKLLDDSGVDYAVILTEIAPITTGIVTNEYVAEFCAESPRLIPFANVNPYLTAHPARELERLVRDLGMRGLKLYPTYAYFYPNEPMLYPLYAKAVELGIPVMWHTGSSVFPGSRLKYGDPLFADDVAVDFPNLTIILAHGGRPCWYDHAFTMARLHENVYIDVGGLPPQNLLRYFPELERLPNKFLFGTDWPGIPGMNMKRNVDAIRNLPISEKTRTMILGENAARILNLK